MPNLSELLKSSPPQGIHPLEANVAQLIRERRVPLFTPVGRLEDPVEQEVAFIPQQSIEEGSRGHWQQDPHDSDKYVIVLENGETIPADVYVLPECKAKILKEIISAENSTTPK